MTMLEWNFLHQLGWRRVQDNSIPWPSATAMGPYGPLQTLNFGQAGLCAIASAIAFRRTTGARVASGFLLLNGVGVLAATFTTDGTTNQPTTWHGWIHGIAFIVHLFATVLAALAVAIQLRNRAEWRWLVIAGIVLVV